MWDLIINYALYMVFYGSIAVAVVFLIIWFIDTGVVYRELDVGREATNAVGVERAQVLAGEEIIGHTVIRSRD